MHANILRPFFSGGWGISLAAPMKIFCHGSLFEVMLFLWPDAIPDANPSVASYDTQGYGVPILNRGTHRDIPARWNSFCRPRKNGSLRQPHLVSIQRPIRVIVDMSSEYLEQRQINLWYCEDTLRLFGTKENKLVVLWRYTPITWNQVKQSCCVVDIFSCEFDAKTHKSIVLWRYAPII